MKKLWIQFFILIYCSSLSAQQYCGTGYRFLIQVVNDTLAKGAFLSEGACLDLPFQDILLTHKGDTTFLNSHRPSRIAWSVISESEANEILKRQLGRPVIVKLFTPNHHSYNPDYYLSAEMVLIMDTQNYQIVYPERLIGDDYIIVVKDYGYVRTFVPRAACPSENERLLLDLKGDHSMTTPRTQCLFNAFPVRITNDSIIPLDEKKNFDCWIENGFRFPPMRRKSEMQQPFYLRGLDLPTVKLESCYSIGYQGIIELRWPQRLLIERREEYYKVIVDD